MATLTRLASTLTARYFPSQSLTDAFYLDGRLCGKRETRQADITIDKDERGFFFSVFTHPAIQGFEPGSLPPFEPQLRDLCNEVKFGHKEIDGMIEKFLSTAVDVAGTMKLSDNEVRKPYFSGVIVRDSEAFAVTIGNGLAFLYRDDTLFPLTDAGIPMEPIDAYGNRVGDFQYYCSSKTANALWSNFFTLAPDDCIILCNKAVYDALGQREILRILTDADDQCDAAGTVITQASARMPNTPMQFAISFVESVTKEEKKGLFGRKKKTREDEEPHLITSTVEGGIVGAAAEAIADAGFVNFTSQAQAAATAAETAAAGTIAFGDQAASAADAVSETKVDFPDDKEAVTEVSAEEVMKNLFGEMQESARKDQEAVKAAAEAASAEEPEVVSPFVAGVEPQTAAEDVTAPVSEEPVKMETISTTVFEADMEDNSPTKPVTDINSILLGAKDGILAQAIKDQEAAKTVVETDPEELKTEQHADDIIPASETEDTAMPFTVPSEPVKAPEVENKAEEIVFTVEGIPGSEEKSASASEAFDPYGKQSSEELMDTPPLVFGDDANAGSGEQPSENAKAIPVPDFELKEEKPVIKEEDKLNVDFPEETPIASPDAEPVSVSEDQVPAGSDDVILPFAEAVETIAEPEEIKTDDVPDMPLYDGDNYDTPVNAVNSEEPITSQTDSAYAYGDYNNAAPDEQAYQPYGSEAFPAEDQTQYGAYNNQDGGTNMSDNNSFTSFGDGSDGSYGGEYQPQYGEQTDTGYADQWAQQPAEDQQPQYQPQDTGDYQDPYAQTASASSSSKLDDDWFNNILGVDDASAGYDYSGTDGQQTQPTGAQQAQYTNPGKSAYRPAGEGPSGPTRRPNARPQSANGGNGGNGGRRKIKLNRNGYIFLAFVAIVIICLIILIAVIAKGCSKKNKPVEESNASTSPVISESVLPSEVPSETVPTPVSDSAPIGYFCFSEYIGFRTWWDVFHYVYNIDIENNSDSRIATIITYNGLDPATYTGPNPGDKLLLPPPGVLSGDITNTFTVVGGPAETTQATDALGNPITPETSSSDAVSGSISVT